MLLFSAQMVIGLPMVVMLLVSHALQVLAARTPLMSPNFAQLVRTLLQDLQFVILVPRDLPVCLHLTHPKHVLRVITRFLDKLFVVVAQQAFIVKILLCLQLLVISEHIPLGVQITVLIAQLGIFALLYINCHLFVHLGIILLLELQIVLSVLLDSHVLNLGCHQKLALLGHMLSLAQQNAHLVLLELLVTLLLHCPNHALQEQ